MDYDVIDVKVPSHLHLQITFRDGVSGGLYMKESYLTGVFHALRDPQVFSKVTCRNGFVEWPNDVDLAPEVLYESIKRLKTIELA